MNFEIGKLYKVPKHINPEEPRLVVLEQTPTHVTVRWRMPNVRPCDKYLIHRELCWIPCTKLEQLLLEVEND